MDDLDRDLFQCETVMRINLLMAVCESQQKIINSLDDRLFALESRIHKMEEFINGKD